MWDVAAYSYEDADLLFPFIKEWHYVLLCDILECRAMIRRALLVHVRDICGQINNSTLQNGICHKVLRENGKTLYYPTRANLEMNSDLILPAILGF